MDPQPTEEDSDLDQYVRGNEDQDISDLSKTVKPAKLKIKGLPPGSIKKKFNHRYQSVKNGAGGKTTIALPPSPIKEMSQEKLSDSEEILQRNLQNNKELSDMNNSRNDFRKHQVSQKITELNDEDDVSECPQLASQNSLK